MTSNLRKKLSIYAGIIISILLMWFLFKDIDYSKLITALKNANYFWLIPNIVLVIFAIYQRAWRWQVMIKPIKKISFQRVLSATSIGFMANNVLPFRLGEFVRAYSLSYQDKDISKSSSLGSIFVERMVFDLVALLIIFSGVITISQVQIPDEMRAGLYMAITIALLGLLFVFILALKPEKAGELLTRYLFFLPDIIKGKISDIVLKFSGGLEFIKKPGLNISVAVQTILLWLFMGLSNYFVMLAFGFDLPVEASYFLLVVVSISILVPSSPGFVGVYHAGTIFTMTQYGISNEEARAFALVLHAAQYIPITLMGFYYLRKSHLSLRQLEKDAVETD